MLIRFQFILAVLLAFIFFLNPVSAEEYTDRIVAVVNEDVITFSELEKAGSEFFNRIRANAPADEVENALVLARKEMLNNLIDKVIVRQEAEELGITVEEAEIDAAIQQLLLQNNATMEQFTRELARVGKTESDLRKGLRDQILQSKLVGYQVQARIVITEEAIKSYYDKEYTAEKGEGGYYILQMGFNWESPGETKTRFSSKEEALEKAKEIRARVIAGESFSELAKEHSTLPSAADGGDIGLFREDEMGKDMRETILALKPGDISPVIETGDGYQFFKLISVTEGDMVVKAPYESVKDVIREKLYRQEMEEQYKVWVEALRSEAYIKKLL